MKQSNSILRERKKKQKCCWWRRWAKIDIDKDGTNQQKRRRLSKLFSMLIRQPHEFNDHLEWLMSNGKCKTWERFVSLFPIFRGTRNAVHASNAKYGIISSGCSILIFIFVRISQIVVKHAEVIYTRIFMIYVIPISYSAHLHTIGFNGVFCSFLLVSLFSLRCHNRKLSVNFPNGVCSAYTHPSEFVCKFPKNFMRWPTQHG